MGRREGGNEAISCIGAKQVGDIRRRLGVGCGVYEEHAMADGIDRDDTARWRGGRMKARDEDTASHR